MMAELFLLFIKDDEIMTLKKIIKISHHLNQVRSININYTTIIIILKVRIIVWMHRPMKMVLNIQEKDQKINRIFIIVIKILQELKM